MNGIGHRFGLKSRTLGYVLILPVLLAGCGGGTDLNGELSDAEAGQLLAALSAVYLPTGGAPTPAPERSGPVLVPTTTIIVDTTQTSVVCPAGGSASVLHTDSVTYISDVRLNPTPDTTYVSEADYSGVTRSTVDYVNCQSRDSGGGTWTFNASPGLAMTYDLTGRVFVAGLAGGGSYSSTTSDLDGLWSGSLGWSNGGRSGECTFSLAMVSRSSAVNGVSSFSYTQSGVICGISVSSSTSSS